MFKSVMVIGHFRGIRIEVHISWLIIFALLMATLTVGLRQSYPDWSLTVAAATALFTSLAFFASIVAHELGHSLVAIRKGIPVNAITLFIFGGMAQISRDSERAMDEFWIAIAGPLVSFALAFVFTALSMLLSGFHEPLSVSLGWLGVINLLVAVFNLIPGFPLDGGRVFRALIWHFTGDPDKAVRAAVMGGHTVAYGLFAVAIWNLLVNGNLVGGLWLALIAWFLFNLADNQGRTYQMSQRLSGVRARDLAQSEIPLADPSMTIDHWINHHVLVTSGRASLVGDDHRVQGLITLNDARKINRQQWSSTPVTEVMTPRHQLIAVDPDTSAEEVLKLINEHNLNQVPVMAGDRVTGWINREQLLRNIALRMELE